MITKKKIVLAVTGASGSIYAKLLLEKLVELQSQIDYCGIIFSDNAKQIWEYEIEDKSFQNYPFQYFEKNNFNAPFASGSAQFNTMIICPCSMGTLGRVASGVSDDLITRAADVMLKERKKLILVTRETPYSLIHINNMKTVTEAGGIICPANPSFYRKPQNFDSLLMSVIERILDLAGFYSNNFQWGK